MTRFRSESEGTSKNENRVSHGLSADPVLARFRRAVDESYAGRVDRVVLFGSRARGDHRPDSDYDVAVFLRGDYSLWDDLEGLATAATDILLDTGVVISAKPFPANDWSDATGLMAEIRRDGFEF